MIASTLRRAFAVTAVVAGTFAALLPGGAASGAATQDGLLAFNDFSTGQIYTVRADGSALSQITHVSTQRAAADPAWSSDGRHLAFVIFDGDGHSRLYTANPDGTGRRQVFSESAGYDDRMPSYTPDNRHVVFSRCTPDFEQCAIHSVGVDGTGLHALTPFAGNNVDFNVASGPDGRLAFERFNAGGVISQAYVARADGSHARAISPARLEAYSPAWSPTGDRILFGSNSSRLGGDIYTVSPAGRHLQRLTRTAYPLYVGSGVYSPTGTHIAVITNIDHPDRCCLDIDTMRTDGTGLTRVPIPLDQIGRVSWASAI